MTREHGLEGVVCKRVDSPWVEGRRTSAWVKVRASRRQTLRITGWIPGQGGEPDEYVLARGAVAAGSVSFGLDAERRAELRAAVTARERLRRQRVRWIDDGVTVEIDTHGRPDGPVRDPVIGPLDCDRNSQMSGVHEPSSRDRERVTIDLTVVMDYCSSKRRNHQRAVRLFGLADDGTIELAVAPQGHRLDADGRLAHRSTSSSEMGR